MFLLPGWVRTIDPDIDPDDIDEDEDEDRGDDDEDGDEDDDGDDGNGEKWYVGQAGGGPAHGASRTRQSQAGA